MSDWWVTDERLMSDWWATDEQLMNGRWVTDERLISKDFWLWNQRDRPTHGRTTLVVKSLSRLKNLGGGSIICQSLDFVWVSTVNNSKTNIYFHKLLLNMDQMIIIHTEDHLLYLGNYSWSLWPPKCHKIDPKPTKMLELWLFNPIKMDVIVRTE